MTKLISMFRELYGKNGENVFYKESMRKSCRDDRIFLYIKGKMCIRDRCTTDTIKEMYDSYGDSLLQSATVDGKLYACLLYTSDLIILYIVLLK